VSPRQAGLLGLLAAVWGASYLLIKYALEGFTAPTIVFGRTLLGVLVLLAVIRAQNGRAWTALADVRRRPLIALGLGAVAIAAPFTLITVGELHVPSGLTAVLIAAAPLWVAVFAPFLDRSEQIDRRQGAGLALGIVGVALLVGVETVSTLAELLGALAILGAAACYALSNFVVKRNYTGFPPIAISAFSVGAAAVLTFPAAVADPPSHAPGLRAVLALVALGALGTAAAFAVYYRLLTELGASRASLVAYVSPPISLAYGAIFLGESITVGAIAGTLLILAGVALASRRQRGSVGDDAGILGKRRGRRSRTQASSIAALSTISEDAGRRSSASARNR
jgi:drug/metabolite transporter (DMT)-like permease